MVVGLVTIQVIDLPGSLSFGKSMKGDLDHSMNLPHLSANASGMVPARMERPQGNDSSSVANSAMRADQPTPSGMLKWLSGEAS